MKAYKSFYLVIISLFLASCATDNDFEYESLDSNQSLTSISAAAVLTCDNPLNGPSAATPGANVSYSVTPKIPTASPSSIQWSTSTPNMTIFSGQGTKNVVVRFSSAFNGGSLSVSINGGACITTKSISKQIPACIDDCGKYLSGSYSTPGYHTYIKTMNLKCVGSGKTITLRVDAIEVPNRFTVRDQNGTFVKSSGWMGYASYPGPWGGSLSTPTVANVTFSKSSSSSSYKLEVETVVPSNQGDSWGASLSCAK